MLKRLMVIGMWVFCVSGVLSLAQMPTIPITLDNASQISAIATLGSGSANDLAWSSDGTRIAVATARGVWLYDPAHLDTPQRLDTGFANTLAFNADGSLMAVGDNQGAVTVFDKSATRVATWQVEPFDPANPASILSVTFSNGSKEGQFIAAATSRNVLGVYNLDNQQVVWTANDGNNADVVRFSNTSKELVCGNVKVSIDIRDTLSGKITGNWDLAPLSIPAVRDMAFSPDGSRLLIAGRSARVLALDFSFGEEGYLWDASSDDIQAVDWSLDGQYVGAVNHSLIDPNVDIVQIWKAEYRGLEVVKLVGHTGTIKGFAFSPDSTQATTVSDDGTLRLWDVATGAEIAQTMGHFSATQDVSMSPDGKDLVVVNGGIQRWNLAEQKVIATFNNADQPTHAYLVPNTSLVSVGNAGINGAHVTVWLPSGTGTTIASFPKALRVFALSADGNSAVVDDGTHAQLLALTSGQITPFANNATVSSAVFMPNMTGIVTGDDSGALTLWTSDAQTATVLDQQSSPIVSLALSRDGQNVAVGWADGSMGVWHVATNNYTWRQPLTVALRQVAFSADGSVMAAVFANGSLQLIATNNGSSVLSAPSSHYTTAVFSQDGSALLTGDGDGLVTMWGVR